MRPSVLWEIWQNKTSKKYFQRFHEPIFLHLLIPSKALKSLRHICSSWLAARLCRNVCLTAHPRSADHIYTDLHHTRTSSVKFFRAIWEAVSWAIVLTLPKTKLNPQLSHCAFFFFDNFIQNSYSTYQDSKHPTHINLFSSVIIHNLNMGNLRHRQNK